MYMGSFSLPFPYLRPISVPKGISVDSGPWSYLSFRKAVKL